MSGGIAISYVYEHHTRCPQNLFQPQFLSSKISHSEEGTSLSQMEVNWCEIRGNMSAGKAPPPAPPPPPKAPGKHFPEDMEIRMFVSVKWVCKINSGHEFRQ